MEGKLVSIENGKMTLNPFANGPVSVFDVTDKTKVTLNENHAELKDLKPGDVVDFVDDFAKAKRNT